MTPTPFLRPAPGVRLAAAVAVGFILLASSFILSANAQSGFVKLPLSINTPDQSELLPVISADGKTLYFTRTRIGMDSTVVFDIWRSHITNDSVFSKPEFVGGNLASSYGIAVTSISPDNNTLYLIGKMESDAPPDERLFVSHKLLGGWSIPEPIKIPNLHPRGIYTDYGFGPDQRTLVMALNRDSSLGDRDLYVSFFNNGKGVWSTPLWLGPEINSRYAEMTPYLASDNKTLYFSSDRPGGIGAVDVYRSIRLDDTWQHWSKPENLGPRVNRPGRTTFYTEDAEGKYGYVSWRLTESDQSDIYRVKVSREQAVALVRGVVHDPDGKPLAAEIHYERLDSQAGSTAPREAGNGSGTGSIVGDARSDPVTGEFEITLPAGARYALRAERDGYFPTSDNIDLTGLKSYEEIHRDLKLNRIQNGAAITLHNVFFETDKADLLPASFEELDRVKQLLTDHPEFKLQIAGFTDSTGTEAHNQLLSKDRAESVVNYLTQHGVAATRLSAIGYGSQKPVATNTTEEGRAKNRRVEFILVSK